MWHDAQVLEQSATKAKGWPIEISGQLLGLGGEEGTLIIKEIVPGNL